MYSWKAIRARLVGAMEAVTAVPPLVVQVPELPVQEVLDRLQAARTVRQALELQSLAVQWPLAPGQQMAVMQAAAKVLERVPTRGPSFPKNSRSRTTRARSTKRHRRAR